MSAFLVHPAHIDLLIDLGLQAAVRDRSHALYFGAGSELRRDNADEVGRMLAKANADSVAYRYEGDPEMVWWPVDAYRYQPRPTPYVPLIGDAVPSSVSPAAALKAISCFEYQSCERPDWSASTAAAYCEAVRQSLIRALPGWDAAPWETRDEARPLPEPPALRLVEAGGAP